MKNKFLLLLLAVISGFILIIPAASASPIISDIHLESIREGSARVVWSTSEPSTGYLYFGASADNMPFYVGDLNMGRLHSADLTGLKSNRGYYYKIVATAENGGRNESFVNYLDTDKFTDTHAATLYDVKKLQTTDTAFALSFFADEPVSVKIKYGTSAGNLNKTWSYGNRKQEFLTIITGLKPATRYYYEITATDEDKNTSSYSGDLTTSSYAYNEIKISNLVPEGSGQTPLLAEGAVITWNTNILATADIAYGTNPKKLNNNQKVTVTSSLSHKAILSKLSPNTTYYYKLKLKSELNKKSFESQIYSFKTAPLTSEYLNTYFKNGDLVKYKSTTYFIYNNTKIALNNNDKIKSISTATPKTITETYFNQYQNGAPYWGVFSDGQVVKDGKKNTIYLIDGNYKRPIANWAVFTHLNYQSKDIVIASSGQLNSYKLGTLIKDSREITGNFSRLNNKLVKSAGDPTVYLVASGKKMPFYSESSFLKRGYNFKSVKTISTTELNDLLNGQLIM
jgi:hypothetical protein